MQKNQNQNKTQTHKLKNNEGEITRKCETSGTGNNAGGCKAGSW